MARNIHGIFNDSECPNCGMMQVKLFMQDNLAKNEMVVNFVCRKCDLMVFKNSYRGYEWDKITPMDFADILYDSIDKCRSGGVGGFNHVYGGKR